MATVRNKPYNSVSQINLSGIKSVRHEVHRGRTKSTCKAKWQVSRGGFIYAQCKHFYFRTGEKIKVK